MNRHHSLPRRHRGFTLAEILIVVAIIAVLVAIAIPVFTTQLEASREATDLSNVRAAYAELLSEVITEGETIFTLDDTVSLTVALKQQVADWQGLAEDAEIGGVPRSEWLNVPQPNGYCTISYSFKTEKVTIDWGGTGGASGGGEGTGEGGGTGGAGAPVTIATGTKTQIENAIIQQLHGTQGSQKFVVRVEAGVISIENEHGNPHTEVDRAEIVAAIGSVEGVTIDGSGRMLIGGHPVTDTIEVHYKPNNKD